MMRCSPHAPGFYSKHYACEPRSYNPPQRKMHIQFQQSCTFHPPPQNMARHTWASLSLTDFLSINPPQYEWIHHKQDWLTTASNISHFLLLLYIIKSYNDHQPIHLFSSDFGFFFFFFFLSADQGRAFLKQPRTSPPNRRKLIHLSFITWTLLNQSKPHNHLSL